MKKLPFCEECKYFGGKGVCKHPTHGGKWEHIERKFWCIKGEFKKVGDTK